MFNTLGNNNSIPNNYVYTSHRGTEYMYLDGSWMNCETMQVVESKHNFKMNQSAKTQIAEHNAKNTLQIGKKYAINESTYTYVGRDNFSLNGNLLSESMNSKVQRLVEADEFKPGQKVDGIPNYFETSYGTSNTRYTYKDGWWIEKDSEHKKALHNPRLSSEITSDALDIIHKHNTDPKAAMPIGSKIDYKGQTLTYIGDAFVTDEGRRTSSEFTDEMERKAKEEKASGQSTEQSQDQAEEQNPENPEQSQSTETNTGSSTEVPNGYVYKSGKGNSYFKKNGKWFSVDTKKPMNNSAIQPLERAAKAQIDKLNSTSPVKIGQEWKSKKGVTYKYVGGDRWISDDGKMLPQSTAKALNQKLASEQPEAGQPEQDSQNSAEAPEEQTQDQQGQEQSSTSQEQQPQPQAQQGAQNGGGDDSLQGLANEIKSNPNARKIVVLLSRGDEVSLLAADILLSGSEKEAQQILNSLNNKD